MLIVLGPHFGPALSKSMFLGTFPGEGFGTSLLRMAASIAIQGLFSSAFVGIFLSSA